MAQNDLKRFDRYWLSANEVENALDYLRRACRFIEETADDKWAWKWTVIALHGALYGVAIVALGSSNSWEVQKYKDRKKEKQRMEEGFWRDHERMMEKWKAFHESGGESGKSPDNEKKLLGVFEALRRLREEPRYWFAVDPSAGKALQQHWSSVEKLINSLRNEFQHFSPKELALGLIDLPQCCMDVLDVIVDIVFHTRTSAALWSQEVREEVGCCVNRAKDVLERCELHQEYLRIRADNDSSSDSD